jgi:predicted AAA+ superfamily ATPase
MTEIDEGYMLASGPAGAFEPLEDLALRVSRQVTMMATAMVTMMWEMMIKAKIDSITNSGDYWNGYDRDWADGKGPSESENSGNEG